MTSMATAAQEATSHAADVEGRAGLHAAAADDDYHDEDDYTGRADTSASATEHKAEDAEQTLQSLCEMFPMLRREEIATILHKRRYQLLPSIDACLLLAQTTNKLTQALRVSSSHPARRASESRPSGLGPSKPPMVTIFEACETCEHCQAKEGATARVEVSPTVSSNAGAYRGTRVTLPESFLRPPSFRVISEAADAEFQHFSVVCYRVHGKIGMQIQKIQSFIVVRALVRPGESPTSSSKESPRKRGFSPAKAAAPPPQASQATPQAGLAERAGVQVGDILTGFDGGLFTPSVQVEDIVWQLAKPRELITLHFKRPLVSDFWSSEKQLHPLATVLLQQKAVDFAQAQTMTVAMALVNTRIRQWRSGFITERVASGRPPEDSGALDEVDVDVSPDICIPTRLLRPGLCVRILGTAVENERTVYVISVVDVESDHRWIIRRRFRAFYELKEKLIAEQPSLAQLNFPHRKLSETQSIVNNRQQVLECYLRELLAMPLLHPLSSTTGRVQLLVQEFLGVPEQSAEMDARQLSLPLHDACRQAMQVHVHAILSIPCLQNVISHFFGRCGRLAHDSKWTGTGTAFVQLVSQFVDSLHTILLDTISLELQHVAKEHGLETLDSIMEQLITAAVRRQVETEVYLPLEEAVLAAVRTEFTPAQRFGIAHLGSLRSEPQSAFDIPMDHLSASSWQSAIDLLAELKEKWIPYDKLQSLVAACKEVPSLYIREHPSAESGALAADDFLPIFIYVLVNANIDDLLDLKSILPVMCEPSQRLSEMGYYVATFEAAIEHLMEKHGSL